MTKLKDTMPVDLSGIKDVDITHLVMRKVGHKDIMMAAARVVPAEGKAIDETSFNLALRAQTIAASIVEVDGKAVVGIACFESMEWSSRTREYVGTAYNFLNGVSGEERESFLERLKTSRYGAPSSTSPTASSDASSKSGVTLPGI
jgi:hypothetical protein